MKILVADDDLISRKALERMLTSHGYEVVLSKDGDEALAILEGDSAPQLAVLDWIMPGRDGKQVCQAVRQRRGDHYTYLIIVTGKSNKEDIIEALEAGADDYLTKPFYPQELRARLIAARRILDLQNELIAARESMRHLAMRDFLTGAWNHRAIKDIIEREVNRAERDVRPVALILVDIDHFKTVNDTHGHLAGDHVLREVAQRMIDAIRPYDYLGRWGGEEFLVVAPGSDLESAAKLAERLRQRLGGRALQYGNVQLPITASFGVAVYSSTSPVAIDAVIQSADVALYQAKKDGRDRVAISMPK